MISWDHPLTWIVELIGGMVILALLIFGLFVWWLKHPVDGAPGDRGRPDS